MTVDKFSMALRIRAQRGFFAIPYSPVAGVYSVDNFAPRAAKIRSPPKTRLGALLAGAHYDGSKTR